jgi:proteasome lid subunit RPN8/RPN11
MTSANEPGYAAVITIVLPGKDVRATVALTLLPPDLVPVSGGEAKPLHECTLAELQDYADALEAEIWQSYREQTLSKLMEEDEITLSLEVLEGGVDTQEELASQPQAEVRPMQAGVEQRPAAKEPEAPAPVAAPSSAELEETPAEPAPVEELPAEHGVAELPAEELPPAAEALPPGDEVAVAGVVPATAPAPDEPPVAPVREMRIAGLRRPLGHPTPAAVDILINEPAFRDAQAHSLSSMNREVAGMLIGPAPEKQPDGRYVVHVSDVIIAKHTRMHGASVTYTPESWRYVTDRLRERYPNEEALIVGWYHTHPGFGIFLSGMDLFIHQNFFTQKWHIALVLDPQARKSGFFCWDRGQTAVQPYEFPWPEWAAAAW